MIARASFITRVMAAAAALALIPVLHAMAAPRDEIVPVDGQNYHVVISGRAGPTVILEAGLGNDISTWRLVAVPVAKFARVVRYERPGLGKSLPMQNHDPVTAEQVAENLHKLLDAARLPPPYILVGHSLGGLYAQMFARKYPGAISGVVLLDSSSADAPSELKTRSQLEPGSAAFLEQAGVAQSNKQVKAAGPFPDAPLTVIAATDHGPYFKEWEPTLMRLQQ